MKMCEFQIKTLFYLSKSAVGQRAAQVNLHRLPLLEKIIDEFYT